MNRDAHSHVQSNGMAKVSYTDRDKAVEIANIQWAADGRPRNVYVCAQKPEHYHIGGGVPDLARGRERTA